jgi:hypothetical protein
MTHPLLEDRYREIEKTLENMGVYSKTIGSWVKEAKAKDESKDTETYNEVSASLALVALLQLAEMLVLIAQQAVTCNDLPTRSQVDQAKRILDALKATKKRP